MTSQTPPGPAPGYQPPGGHPAPPGSPQPGPTSPAPGYPPPQGPTSAPGYPPPGYPPPQGPASAPGYPPPGYPPPGYASYPPPPGYPAYTYGPFPAASPGLIGRTRSIGISILLSIVTIGIYNFVWVYKTHDEMKRYSGRGIGGGLGLLIYFLFSPATFFLVPIEAAQLYQDVDRRPSPVSAIIGLWFLLPIIGWIIWFVKVQGALNEYWQSKGAPPP